MQEVLGCFQERLAYSEKPMEDLAGEEVNGLTQLLAQSDEPTGKKKCTVCGKVKSLKDFYTNKSKKDGHHSECKKCGSEWNTKHRNTEIGYLKHRYDNMSRNFNVHKGRYNKRLLTFDELLAAWEKHKSIYGMKSAWGPGIDHLEQHLPITIITPGTTRVSGKKVPRVYSNLSADRLDSSKDYTIQNLIFIRNDENVRKKDTSYEDCKIQMRLHEERFKNEME